MAVTSLPNREEKPVQTKRVAVIGAGVSGVVTAKYLKASGLDVVVFERSKQAGGNWVYDERKPLEPRYPSEKASLADFVPDRKPTLNGHNGESNGVQNLSSEEEELAFAPPGPAYSGLTNNVPTTLQSLKEFPWPEGTPDFVNVRDKQKYIQGYAKAFSIEPLIRYSARVERLRKVDRKWRLTATKLFKDEVGANIKLQSTEDFDFVVVASGHYHSPRVPAIPGLKEWKSSWPEKVQHSKGYRKPDEFRDQTVLLVGAGVSSTDIAREITPFAKKIYQSSRGGQFDLPLGFLPEGTERVAGVSFFEIPSNENTTLGAVTLSDGRVLHVDRVIIATGYLMTVPFLPELNADSIPIEEANDTVLVTDGTQYHNLHRDIFYIPDSTLAFVGVPAYSATFTFFEFQAIAVDAVFSGRTKLPSEHELRTEYRDKVQKKGYGRAFHSVKDEEVQYVRNLVDWVNSSAELNGWKKVEPHSDKWIAERALLSAKYQERMKKKA